MDSLINPNFTQRQLSQPKQPKSRSKKPDANMIVQASPIIDYNLRQRGKRFLATRIFLSQWHFHLRPRAIIERHFAWAKRYFGLQSARWRGLTAAYQHTALVYSIMLSVAIVAHRRQRPGLAGSRTRVLALKTIA